MAKREIKTIFALDGETKYRDAIRSINKEQQLLRAELKAVTSEFDASGDAQKKLTVQADSLAKQIDLQKKKIAEAQNAVEQATKAYGENSETTKKYKIDLANAEAQLGRLQTQLANTNKELLLQSSRMKDAGDVIEKAGQKMKSVGEGMEKVGKGLTAGVTAPIVAAGAGLLKLANDFDDAVDTIRISSGATGEALQGLVDDFDAVIGKVPADMDVAANAIADLNTRLGLTGEPLQELAQQYLELAHITGEDVTTSIRESTRAFQAWKIPADKMSQGLNTIFKVSQSTGIRVNELTRRVTDFTPAMQELGFTFEESVALIGKFEKEGVKTDAVLGAMKRALSSFAKEGKTASQGLAELSNRIKNAKDETEAAQLAIEIFGTRAGPELAHHIRSGRLDIEEFTKSIMANTETINSAATDTYDYAEQWKMLTNQLAKDLRPVAQQIFDAINNATPTIKSAAEWVGNLAQKFSELSPKQQETILKMAALAAAAGPVLSITSKLTTTIGGATEAIGKFVSKIAEKRAAAEAAKLATEGLSASGASLTSVFGPAAAIIGGVTLAVAGLTYAYKDSIKPAKEAGEAATSFMKGVANWKDGVSQAKSALEGFNKETIMSREKMTELEEGIRTAQENIIKIAETAAAESRAYTEEERRQIEELVGLIADYTQKKIEAYQEQAKVVAAMATMERDVTIARAQELIKGAEDARQQTLAVAQARYAEHVAEAEKLYGHLGELDKARYDEMVRNAQAEYDKQLEMANKTYGDTLAIIQQKYAEYHTEDMKYFAQISNITRQLEELETRKNEFYIQKIQERKEQLKSETLSLKEQSKIQAETEGWYAKERKRLLEELAGAYKQAEEKNLDSWLGMVMHTELYGGQINEKSKEIATGIIGSFEHLPEDAKKTMSDTMQGMMKEMENKEPSLFQKAKNIASGILNTLKKAFDIRSPSREMQKITEQLFAGMDKPMADAARKLPDKMAKIADKVLAEAEKMSETQRYLHERVDNSGLNTQISKLQDNNIQTGFGTTNNICNTHSMSITIINRGTLIGSRGMNEFADIISRKIAGQYGLRTGGAW